MGAQDVVGRAGGDGPPAGLNQGPDESGGPTRGVVPEASGGLGGGEGGAGAGQGMKATGPGGDTLQVLVHEDLGASLEPLVQRGQGNLIPLVIATRLRCVDTY